MTPTHCHDDIPAGAGSLQGAPAVAGEPMPAVSELPVDARARRRFRLVFIAVGLLVAGFYLDSLITPNPTSRALPALALVSEGRLSIDTHHQATHDKSLVRGHYFSDKAPLSTFVVLPAFALYYWLGGHRQAAEISLRTAIRLGGLLCGTVPFLVLIWLSAGGTKGDGPGAFQVAWWVYLGSFLFGYAGVYFGHLLAAALLLGSYICLKRGERPVFCGVLLGAAFLAEYPVALAGPFWLWGWWRQPSQQSRLRATLRFSLGTGLVAGTIFVYNALITGHPLHMVYSYVSDPQFSAMRSALGFRLPRLEAVWGLLFSPARGLFIYTPVLWLALWCFLRKPQCWRQTLRLPLFGFSAAFFVLIASYYMWEGGWCYGPRHLIPPVALVLYECVRGLRSCRVPRWIFYAFTGVGVLANWLVKSSAHGCLLPSDLSSPLFQLTLPELRAGHFTSDGFATVCLGLSPVVSVALWPVVFLVGSWVLARCESAVTGPNQNARR